MVFENKMRLNKLFSLLLFMAFVLLNTGDVRAGFLYVLNDNNAPNSQIYGYNVNEQTGALTLLSGFPVNPGVGGNNSIVSERLIADPLNNRLYAINDGSDSFAAYTVDGATGALTAMPFSPVALGSGGWNTIRVHPTGSPLIVTNGLTGGASRSFNITATTAVEASGSPYVMPTGTSAFSSIFSPNGNYFYVGGNTGTAIVGYEVNAANGNLTMLVGSPFDSGAANPLAYAMDSSGRLFTVNSNDDVRAFTSSSGILSPVTGNPFPPAGLTQRRYGLVHPNQNFYIVAGNSGNNVGVFRIAGSGASTTLAAVAGSPFPTGGTTANNLAINQSGEFLYVGNRISRNVTTFNVNSSTGVLTSLGVQPSSTNGTTGAVNGIAYLPNIIVDPANTRFDFDGDGRADISVFRPSNGAWYIQQSTAGFKGLQFGFGTDLLAPADFDGDGKTDVAVFRDGFWYYLKSSDNSFVGVQWGLSTDIPLPADFDGDGKADINVFRPSNGFWYRLNSLDNQFVGNAFGQNGDKPLIGDFNGDGKADLAVFRPSAGSWYIARPTGIPAQNFDAVQFGFGTDIPTPADFDGDRKTDIAVFRPSNGAWYRLNSSDGSFFGTLFGQNGDTPVPADFDGDGRADIAVVRNGNWYYLNSSNGAFVGQLFGLGTDKPIPAAFNP